MERAVHIPAGEGGLELEASDTGILETSYGLGGHRIRTELAHHTLLLLVLHIVPVSVEWVLREGDIDLQFVLGSRHSS